MEEDKQKLVELKQAPVAGHFLLIFHVGYVREFVDFISFTKTPRGDWDTERLGWALVRS